MLEGTGALRRVLDFVLLALVTCNLSCTKDEASVSTGYSYALSRDGYSSSDDALVLYVFLDESKPSTDCWLAVYSKATGSMTRLAFRTGGHPFDVAWAPGQSLFAVAHGDGITLFRKAPSTSGYSRIPIPCPAGATYMYCAWDPTGEWLGVVCHNYLSTPAGYRLGLYGLKEGKFEMTNIVADHHGLVWTDRGSLYVTNNIAVTEVRLGPIGPEPVRTIPLGHDVGEFYGVFDDQALIYTYEGLQLGDRTLAKRDPAKGFGVIATKTLIFVSTSSSLAAFDHTGREIDRIDQASFVRLGSIGEGQDTVYAVAGSKLLHVSVISERLHIHEVCDLDRWMLGMPGTAAPSDKAMQ